MRSFASLVKLARFKVEELQRQMAMLDDSRAHLEGRAAELERSVPEEQIAADATKEGYLAYGSYAQAVIVRKENLNVSLVEIDAQTAALRVQLEDAFRELKKFELMEERRLKQIAEANAKAEQAELDEIAGVRAARR
ncbi:Flagellar protein FliJ [hydrothermal vent metagenome]|uniref:Flagellar protein FliJ n=1 Tax=hydrothermal vent metagenome TaxID=652676 RepID=A0A3B0RJH2_9ZZZZ